MIKAKLSNGALVLGIEERNVRLLKLGNPIHISAAEIGGFENVTELLIVYGDTLRIVYNKLNDAMGGQLPPFEEPKKRTDA